MLCLTAGLGQPTPGVGLMEHGQVGPGVLGLSDSSWVCSLNSTSAAWAKSSCCAPFSGLCMNEHKRGTVSVALTPPTGLTLIRVSASLCSQLFITLFWYHPFLFGEKMGNLRRLSSF